jgi:hypothetical protein
MVFWARCYAALSRLPGEETATVRRIFHEFVIEYRSLRSIARESVIRSPMAAETERCFNTLKRTTGFVSSILQTFIL